LNVLTCQRSDVPTPPPPAAQHAGGIGEVARALRAALEIVEVPTLVEYANQMENKSLGSRLGYLLETYGRPADGLAHSASPVKLDPTRPRTGRTVARRQIVVNIPENELVNREGVG
jgi:predicted transcriptional regulator of viral defense system